MVIIPLAELIGDSNPLKGLDLTSSKQVPHETADLQRWLLLLKLFQQILMMQQQRDGDPHATEVTVQ